MNNSTRHAPKPALPTVELQLTVKEARGLHRLVYALGPERIKEVTGCG